MRALLGCFLVTVASAANAASAPATTTPEELGKLWAKAIQDNSAEELKPLIHPDCVNGEIKESIKTRMVTGGLPPSYTIATEDMATPAEQLDKIFLVRPEKNLVIHYNTEHESDRSKYGIGKAFPIAQKDGHWYFAVCQNK
jgi:hypothetical protein